MSRVKYAMMLSAALIVVMCLVFSAPVGAESDNEIVIEGDYVLTENVTFEDGSIIVIKDGTNITISNYRIDFGSGSTVNFEGSFTVSMGMEGRIIAGVGTKVNFSVMEFDVLEQAATVLFNGVVKVESNTELVDDVTMEFDPATADHSIRVQSEDRMLVADDLKFHYIKTILEERISASFSTVSYATKNYDDTGAPITTVQLTMEADPNKIALDLSKSLGTTKVNVFNVDKFTIVKTYVNSGMVNTISVSGVNSVNAYTDMDGKFHLDARANKVEFERINGGALEGTITFNLVSVSTILSTGDYTIFDIIFGNAQITELSLLEFASETVDMFDKEGTKVKTILNFSLSLEKQPTDDYHMVLAFNDEGTDFKIVAYEAEIKEFGLSSDMLLDADIFVPKITLDIDYEDGSNSRGGINDIDLIVRNMDIVSLYMIISTSGRLDIQAILDHSDRVEMTFDLIWFDYDDDGIYDDRIESGKALLCKDAKGMNTFSMSFESIMLTLPLSDWELTIDMKDTELYLASNGSLTESLDALFRGVTFTTDSYTEIELSTSGFKISLVKDGYIIRVFSDVLSEVAPRYITLTLTMDHSMYLDKTEVSGKIIATGYSVTMTIDIDNTDPVGTTNVVLVMNDLSVGFNVDFGEEIAFGVNITAPWTLDVQYYDIAFQIDGAISSITISHGKLYVQDYDTAKEGYLQLIVDLIEKDFSISMRPSIICNSLTIYRNDRTEVFAAFTDADISIKELAIDMRRNDTLHICVTNFRLDAMSESGPVEKAIAHLDINKDLSGEEREGFFKKASPMLLTAFSVIAAELLILLVYLRIKKPELFKIAEIDSEEASDLHKDDVDH